MLINGCNATQIDAKDRGLQYGDGLFETIAVSRGVPCLWERHMQRLLSGCDRLKIPRPDVRLLHREVLSEIATNGDGVVKIIVTRGVGARGYAPDSTGSPTRIVSWSQAPAIPAEDYTQGIIARICQTRLGHNSLLAGIKHLNRLEQVIARAEWSDPEIKEGIMLDAAENVIECTSSNLFLIKSEQLYTPSLERCGVAGIMRGLVIDIAEALGMDVKISEIGLDELASAEALFITNSLYGIRPLSRVGEWRYSVDGIPGALVSAAMQRGFRHA